MAVLSMPTTSKAKAESKLSPEQVDEWVKDGLRLWEEHDYFGDFDEFSPEDRYDDLRYQAEEWIPEGFDAYRACFWRNCCQGFQAKEATPWRDNGFGPHDASEAAGKYETPEEALAAGYEPYGDPLD